MKNRLNTQDINRIQLLQQSGKLVEAEVQCRRLTVDTPDSAEAIQLHGIILSQLRQHKAAIAQLTKANALSPKNYIFVTNLGAAYAADGAYEKAAECFRNAIAIKSSIPEAHYNLGNALKDLGQYEEAIKSYRKALQLKPNYPAAWNNLGAMYTQFGLVREASSAILRALSIKADYAQAQNNMANVWLLQGKITESINCCIRALNIDPNYVDAYRSMGMAMISSRRFGDAISAFERAIQVGADSINGYIELARAQLLCGYYDGVVTSLEKILEFEPLHQEALKLMGIVQMERGYYEEANNAFARTVEVAPLLSVKIRYALSLPPILNSSNDISQLRQKINSQLDLLSTDDTIVADPYNEQIGPNFFLAYHGLNDRDLQMKIARLYEKCCPSLRFVSTHCKQDKIVNSKIRVGFLSKYIYKHSVATCFSRIIQTLSKSPDLELYLISTTNHEHEDVKKIYPDFQGTFVTIPYDLFRSQHSISVLALDCLIYLDLGMEPLSFLLAFARLAHVQCVMGGHPVTTGIPNVDYFISSDIAEPANGEEHYSEKLIRLSSGGFYYERSKLPAFVKSRATLELPLNGNIYICPMMLQKIHPDFDAVMAKILSLDSTGHIVLFESPQHDRWNHLLNQRLDSTIPSNLRGRIVFHKWIVDADDFISVISHASVVIDPIHFGIGSTAIPVFSVGIPLVTWPGEYMRGRAGYAYCKLLDISECIAADLDDYAQKAVKIANTPALHNELSRKILSRGNAIFENEDVSTELEEVIKKTVRSKLMNA
jgi:protein O-GlcNAc transferase